MATRKPTATSGGTARERFGHGELPPSHAAAESAAVEVDEQRGEKPLPGVALPKFETLGSRLQLAAAVAPPAIPASPRAAPGPAAGRRPRISRPQSPPRPCTRSPSRLSSAPRNSTCGAKGKTLRYSKLPRCGLITASASKRNRSSRASTICRCSLTPAGQLDLQFQIVDVFVAYTSNSIPSPIPAGVAGPAG